MKRLLNCTPMVLAGMMSLLAACSPQVLPPSGSHPLTPWERVLIYQKEPAKYELIGEISLPVTPDMRWDEHGDSTPGFEALKNRASAMGGNGVLLKAKDGKNDYVVGAGYRGVFYQVPMRREPHSVVASAIYMLEE
jgi:hypothetical protein